jgi:hypothetical protein
MPLGEFTDILQVAFGTVEQYSVELFYRVQLTQEFQVTPSVQFIVDPAFNLEEDTIAVLGLRAARNFSRAASDPKCLLLALSRHRRWR